MNTNSLQLTDSVWQSEIGHRQYTGGGQKLRTGSRVLPVAENILSETEANAIQLKMLFATGRTRLSVRSFCPPPVNMNA